MNASENLEDDFFFPVKRQSHLLKLREESDRVRDLRNAKVLKYPHMRERQFGKQRKDLETVLKMSDYMVL